MRRSYADTSALASIRVLAFAALWIVGQPAIAFADPEAGKGIFEAKGCGQCHVTAGPVDPLPVAERTAIKGPPLWFAGSKFQQDWLVSWLAKPTPIRRVRYASLEKGANDHPALAAGEAADVASYLSTLSDPEPAAGVVEASKLSRRKAFKAEKLFSKKQVCWGCHLYPSKQGEIGGFSGPSLVGAGARLKGDWVYAFLKDSLRYYPNGRMPVYGDQPFEPFSDAEFKLLAEFMGSM